MTSANEITHPAQRRFLSTDDLAALLDMTPAGVRYRQNHGLDLPYGERVGRDPQRSQWVYCREDVERWLHAQRSGGSG
jgi:hypothetical protein